jgi:hypothetical protein
MTLELFLDTFSNVRRFDGSKFETIKLMNLEYFLLTCFLSSVVN